MLSYNHIEKLELTVKIIEKKIASSFVIAKQPAVGGFPRQGSLL